MTRVGVVGLGIMGRRIATTLANAGMAVTAFDLSQDAMDRARDAELQLESSLADLAAQSDVVLLSLPTPAVVLDVVGQIQSTGHPVVVLDTSTIDPDTARACRDIWLRPAWTTPTARYWAAPRPWGSGQCQWADP